MTRARAALVAPVWQDDPHIVTTAEALRLVPHLPAGDAQLILVCGMRGYGKTVFVQGMPDGSYPYGYIEEREPRLLVLDIHDDYQRIQRRVEWRDALADLNATDGPCRRRVVVSAENCSAFADEFFPAIIEEDVRNFLLVIEEASAFCKSINIKGTALETIILQGRHWGIRVLAVAQRLGRLPGEFHSEATQIVSYRMKRPRDLYILEEWGFQDAEEVAPTLPVGVCWLDET